MSEQHAPANQASESTPLQYSAKPGCNEAYTQQHEKTLMRVESCVFLSRESSVPALETASVPLATKTEPLKLDTSPKERGEKEAPQPRDVDNDYAASRPSLDADFKLRRHPGECFQLGKVFLTFWSEPPKGGGQQNGGSLKSASHSAFHEPDMYINEFGERIFSKVRRFIVVRDNDNPCSALAITTHSGRCSTNPEHGIVYTGNPKPSTEMPDDETSNLKKEVLSVQVDFGPESPVTRMKLKAPANLQRKWGNCFNPFARISVPRLVCYGVSAGCLKPRFIQVFHSWWDELQQKVASMPLTRKSGWNHEIVDDDDDDDDDQPGSRPRGTLMGATALLKGWNDHSEIDASEIIDLRKALLAGYSVGSKENQCRTLFPIAAEGEHLSTMQLLLFCDVKSEIPGEGFLSEHSSDGRIHLHEAAAGRDPGEAKFLLICDALDEDKDDMTAQGHIQWTRGHRRKVVKVAIVAMMLPCLRVLHNYATSHASLPAALSRLADWGTNHHEPAWLANPDPLLLLLASMTGVSLMASYHRLNPDDGAQDIIIGISLIMSIAAGLLAGHSMAHTTLAIAPSALCAGLLLSDVFHTGLSLRQRCAMLSWDDERQSTADGLSQDSVHEKFEEPSNEDAPRKSEDLEAQNG